MARNGIGVTGSLVHAPSTKAYEYRADLGMVPSAEFSVFFDDFGGGVASNVPAGWSAAIIDTGATVTTYTTLVAGSQGVIQLLDATASEGAAIYLPKSVQLTAGKKFFMEAKVYTDDVTDNNFLIGLSDLTATTNPEDLYSTTSASLITFGLGDGDSNPKMLVDKSNSGTDYQTQTVKGMSTSTWHTLGIGYDGSKVKGYVDGKLALTWASADTTIPTGILMAPFISHVNGNGAGGNVCLVDYFRYAVER